MRGSIFVSIFYLWKMIFYDFSLPKLMFTNYIIFPAEIGINYA